MKHVLALITGFVFLVLLAGCSASTTVLDTSLVDRDLTLAKNLDLKVDLIDNLPASGISSLDDNWSGVINGSTITISIRTYSSCVFIDRTKLILRFTLGEGETLKVGDTLLESGVTAYDWSEPRTVTYTDADLKSCNYTVQVLLQPSLDQLKLMIANNLDIRYVDLTEITDMTALFALESTFNQDISHWDTSHVTKMGGMFQDAKAFNQDIGKWDVSRVTDMGCMFFNAESFNQDLSAWDVSQVTNMSGMFRGAAHFNQDISAWNVSQVKDMDYMFLENTEADSADPAGKMAFGQDISAWGALLAENTEHECFMSMYAPANEHPDWFPWSSWRWK